MLQQTTVQAVMDPYQSFMERFPNLSSLAAASTAEVETAWAGLGYYTRARNLHRAAQKMVELGVFPSCASELKELPGFGPYTSRSLASLAFGEKVGVLDGNVIRVLTRLFALKIKWWESRSRNALQELADAMALQSQNSSDFNQGLMEIGATLCRPKSAHCLLCPLRSHCKGQSQTDQIPMAKPRRGARILEWDVELKFIEEPKTGQKVCLVTNQGQLPFLKGRKVFPGELKEPKGGERSGYLVRHQITNFDIRVFLKTLEILNGPNEILLDNGIWVPLQGLKSVNPSSLMQKILDQSRNILTS